MSDVSQNTLSSAAFSALIGAVIPAVDCEVGELIASNGGDGFARCMEALEDASVDESGRRDEPNFEVVAGLISFALIPPQPPQPPQPPVSAQGSLHNVSEPRPVVRSSTENAQLPEDPALGSFNQGRPDTDRISQCPSSECDQRTRPEPETAKVAPAEGEEKQPAEAFPTVPETPSPRLDFERTINGTASAQLAQQVKNWAKAGPVAATPDMELPVSPPVEAPKVALRECPLVPTAPLFVQPASYPLIFSNSEFAFDPSAVSSITPDRIVEVEVIHIAQEHQSALFLGEKVEITIKPEPTTSIRLEFQQTAGVLQVQAFIENGDAPLLSAVWEQLQEKLSTHSIALGELQRPTVITNVFEDSESASNAQEQPKPIEQQLPRQSRRRHWRQWA